MTGENACPTKTHAESSTRLVRAGGAAEDSRRAERHEWACFAAQQAAEKAVKALHRSSSSCPPELIEKARVLDTSYIPSRYPNSHPDGAPFEHYGVLQSEEAIRYAGEIIAFVRARMA